MAEEGKIRVETLARLINVTPRRVQQLAKEGIVQKGGRGFYDLVTSIQGYCKFLQDQLEGRPTQDITARLKDEQLRKARLENDEREMKLLAFEEVQELVSETAAVIAQMCDALDDRLAPLVTNVSNPVEIKAIIHEETNRIRQVVADNLANPRTAIGVRRNPQTTPRKNGRPMGKH